VERQIEMGIIISIIILLSFQSSLWKRGSPAQIQYTEIKKASKQINFNCARRTPR